MNEAKKAELKSVASKFERAERDGLIASWIAGGADLGERAVTSIAQVAQEAREELQQRVVGTIEWVEGVEHSLNKVARSAVERIGDFAEEAIKAGEGAALGVVHVIRVGGGALIAKGKDALPKAA